MKTYSILFTVLFCFIFPASVVSQEKDLKANTNQETSAISAVASLLNSKTFEFIANTTYPTSGIPKNLVGSNYSMTFSPKMIISNLPYYGRGYSTIAISRDKGMRFEGTPENFIIKKDREYQVRASVNSENDTYEISLSVSDSGYASLSISSNNRGTISYQGEVVPIQKK